MEEEARPGSRGHGGLFWAGLALIAVGLAMLGWVAWQFWGTSWVSKREQREITASLEQQWERGGAKLAPAYVPEGEASALIRIPKFGRDYVVPVLEGTDKDTLTRGYGHFVDTADPGQVGNYAVAAHRITHGEPLRRMPELKPGDAVIVETVEATYTYELTTNPNDLVIPFTGSWVLASLPVNPDGGPEPAQRPRRQRLLTLTTCSELFHTDERMIAFARLVEAEKKRGAPAAAAAETP